jgi:hypothetical protein
VSAAGDEDLHLTSDWNRFIASELQKTTEKLVQEESLHLKKDRVVPIKELKSNPYATAGINSEVGQPARNSSTIPEYNIMIDVPQNAPAHLQPQVSLSFNPVHLQNLGDGRSVSPEASLRVQINSLSQQVEALNIENESLKRMVRRGSLSRSPPKSKKPDVSDNNTTASFLGPNDQNRFQGIQDFDLVEILMAQAKVIEKCIEAL